MEFVVPSRRLSFVRGQFADLLTTCEEDARATEIIRVDELGLVALHPQTGRTVSGGLQYNKDAFRQVCAILSGGLNACLITAERETGLPAKDSRSCVIRAFNNFCRLGEDRIRRYKLVVDRRNGEIVGLIGLKYRRVANAEIVRTVGPFLAARHPSQHVFIRADVRNRDLFSLFAKPTTVRGESQVDWVEGLAVFNSETTKRAVALPSALLDSRTGGFSSQPEDETNRLIHRKRKGFDQLLHQLVVDAFNRQSWLPDLCPKIRALAKQTHDVGPPLEALHKRCQLFLASSDVGPILTERVVRAIKHGDRRGTTSLDFYFALLTVADESMSAARQLRTLAYSILTGK